MNALFTRRAVRVLIATGYPHETPYRFNVHDSVAARAEHLRRWLARRIRYLDWTHGWWLVIWVKGERDDVRPLRARTYHAALVEAAEIVGGKT